MLSTVSATGFLRVLETGRNAPLLLECENSDGGVVEVVTKLSRAECGLGGLIREAVSAAFAADLNLPVPEPFLVELSDEFIGAFPEGHRHTRDRVRSSNVFGFGS